MAHAGQHDPGALAAHAAFDRVELGERAVRVGISLDQQHGTRDSGEPVLDVPRPELRRQPHVVPAAEHAVGIVVVAGETRRQVAVLVAAPGRLDPLDRPVLDEHVRRQQHQPAHCAAAAGVQQGDRRPVAVPDEESAP